MNATETMNGFAMMIGYSDVQAHEVVRAVSGRTLEVRRMTATRSNPENNLGFMPGGFVGHCANQNQQEWNIVSDGDAKVFRIRLGKQGWKDSSGRRFSVEAAPRCFYDYNF